MPEFLVDSVNGEKVGCKLHLPYFEDDCGACRQAQIHYIRMLEKRDEKEDSKP